MRLRLVSEPPSQDAWMALGDFGEPNVYEARLPAAEIFRPLGRLTTTSIPAQVALDASKAYWDFAGQWLLGEIQRLAAGEPLPLRLNIVTAAPSLWTAPWEWLELAFEQHAPQLNVTINRAVPMHYSAPRLRVRDGLRLCVLPSNPKDERKMNVSEELNCLRTSPEVHRMEATSGGLAEVVERMADFQPNVLHYIGHAGIDGIEGNLILEGPKHTTEWVNTREFLKLLHPSVRLLCLSTCVTAPNYDIRGFTSFILSDSCSRLRPLPSAVVTQFPVKPESALAFWETFYRELPAQDSSLTAAVVAGRRAVRQMSQETADWSSFVLVLREQFTDEVGKPFAFDDRAAGVDPQLQPTSAESALDLHNYFSSVLANQLESLHSESSVSDPSESTTRQGTSEILSKLQATIDDIKKSIR